MYYDYEDIQQRLEVAVGNNVETRIVVRVAFEDGALEGRIKEIEALYDILMQDGFDEDSIYMMLRERHETLLERRREW